MHVFLFDRVLIILFVVHKDQSGLELTPEACRSVSWVYRQWSMGLQFAGEELARNNIGLLDISDRESSHLQLEEPRWGQYPQRERKAQEVSQSGENEVHYVLKRMRLTHHVQNSPIKFIQGYKPIQHWEWNWAVFSEDLRARDVCESELVIRHHYLTS